MMRIPTAARLLAPALAALALSGCSGGESMTQVNPEGESRKVSDVVENFNEARGNVKRSEPLFVKGALPKGDAFKKYTGFSYFTTGTARPDGDSATMEVTVRNEKTGEDAGKVEWTFKKEGDAWKIEKAPLP